MTYSEKYREGKMKRTHLKDNEIDHEKKRF